MSKLNGTKLLTVSLDLDTYNKLKAHKKDKTWLEFLKFIADAEVEIS